MRYAGRRVVMWNGYLCSTASFSIFLPPLCTSRPKPSIVLQAVNRNAPARIAAINAFIVASIKGFRGRETALGPSRRRSTILPETHGLRNQAIAEGGVSPLL